jgi:acetyl-CoA carboxylase biotin carboxyl carrier protein
MAKAQKDRIAKLIEELSEILKQEGLAELTVSDGELSVTLRAPNPEAQVAASVSSVQPIAKEAGPDLGHLLPIKSPMTGIFYTAPSPGDPPFVEVGDLVEPGQTVGLIEAMKVFSEIPSEVGGRIVEIVAKDAELVPEGAALMVVDPTVQHE